MSDFLFPPPAPNTQVIFGVHPVDFLLETVLKIGLNWLREDVKNAQTVLNHLTTSWLTGEYGTKPEEFYEFFQKYEVPIVQHFSLIARQNPCISIQILDANEAIERAGLADFQGYLDTLEGDKIGSRRELKYSPITDNIHLGIHANQPDMAKYLYYFVVYILNAYKPQLEARGLHLGTFRATDLSMMNQYLPENVYSRFITFTVFSWASFDAGEVPIIEKVLGIHMAHAGEEPTEDISGNPMPDCGEENVSAERVTDTFGLTACDINEEFDDEQ